MRFRPSSAPNALLLTLLLATGAAHGAGVDMSNLDTGAAACTDFFRFATGKWQDSHPVPADRARWGSFDQLEQQNRAVLVGLLQEAAKAKAPAGSLQRKLGDFYISGMAAQTGDAKDGLAAALAVTGQPQYAASMGGAFALLHAQGAAPGFQFVVRPDPHNATRYIPQLFQGGLGLPEREYYLAKDEKSVKIREAYVAHIARLSELLGVDKAFALKGAQAIMELETSLAEAHMTRAEARDPDKSYHAMRINDLKLIAPNFNWNEYFNTLEITTPGTINVGQPEYFKAFSRLLKEVPTNVWRDYASWHTLHAVAPYLGGDIEREHFEFYGKLLSGTEKMEPPEKRVAAVIDRSMGEALGELYVAKNFSPKAKQKALDLVKNVRLALRERIAKLEWMSAETRKEALAKLDAINVKIGYPDAWKDYSMLNIRPDSYVANILDAQRLEFHRQIDRLGKPIDRNLWSMTPPTVNAYYNASLNEIVFPAGILQPPFFDEHADDASNYGGIGTVIGHELTHGFDDRGRKFDAKGNRRDWWTADDEAKYVQRADAIAAQYDAFEPLPGLHLNGRATLGENIADFGGTRIAYLALQKALHGKPPRKIDGYSQDQRFYLAYAQIWRQTIRDDELRKRILTDSHSPGRYRVMGPLANSNEFQNAFQCKTGDAMMRAPAERVAIW